MQIVINANAMKNKPIIVGDQVVFSQHYLFDAPHAVGKIGIVKSVEGDFIMVDFGDARNPLYTVLADDVEPYNPKADYFMRAEDMYSYEDQAFASDSDFGGMSTSQLIALKLQAQETDPELDKSIRRLLNCPRPE